MSTEVENLSLVLYNYIFKNYILNSHINNLFITADIQGVLSGGVYVRHSRKLIYGD